LAASMCGHGVKKGLHPDANQQQHHAYYKKRLIHHGKLLCTPSKGTAKKNWAISTQLIAH
jgi:hypothetical protein